MCVWWDVDIELRSLLSWNAPRLVTQTRSVWLLMRWPGKGGWSGLECMSTCLYLCCGGESAGYRYTLWSGNLEVAGRREECGWPGNLEVKERRKEAGDRYRLWSWNLEVNGRREECGWPVHTVIGEPGGRWEVVRVWVTGEPGGKSPRGKYW